MDLKSILALLGPIVQPLATEVLNQVIIPAVNKLEGEIGSDAIKSVVAALTTAIENLAVEGIAKI